MSFLPTRPSCIVDPVTLCPTHSLPTSEFGGVESEKPARLIQGWNKIGWTIRTKIADCHFLSNSHPSSLDHTLFHQLCRSITLNLFHRLIIIYHPTATGVIFQIFCPLRTRPGDDPETTVAALAGRSILTIAPALPMMPAWNDKRVTVRL